MNATHTGDASPDDPEEPEKDQSCDFCCENPEIRVFETLMNSECAEGKIVRANFVLGSRNGLT
jgi:hypothetical protein